MRFLTALAWALNIWVVLTYAMMVRGRWSQFRFDVANALGFIPTATLNILAGVYPPLVLTVSFGLIGLYGTVKELLYRHRRYVTFLTIGEDPVHYSRRGWDEWVEAHR